MNETTNTATDATPATPAGATVADPLAEQRKTVNGLRRKAYPVRTLEQRLPEIQGAADATEALGLPVATNYDPSEGVPQGYGMAIIPVPKNQQGASREVKGIILAAVPDYQTIAEAEGGLAWLEALVNKECMTLLANRYRAHVAENEAKPTAMLTVADFITNQRAAESLDGFNAVYGPVMAALKEMKLKGLTRKVLLDVLTSKGFAEQRFPAIPQEQWEGVIKLLIQRAEDGGHEVGAMAHWVDTRKATEVDSGTFDLGALTAKMAETTEQPATTEGASA